MATLGSARTTAAEGTRRSQLPFMSNSTSDAFVSIAPIVVATDVGEPNSAAETSGDSVTLMPLDSSCEGKGPHGAARASAMAGLCSSAMASTSSSSSCFTSSTTSASVHGSTHASTNATACDSASTSPTIDMETTAPEALDDLEVTAEAVVPRASMLCTRPSSQALSQDWPRSLAAHAGGNRREVRSSRLGVGAVISSIKDCVDMSSNSAKSISSTPSLPPSPTPLSSAGSAGGLPRVEVCSKEDSRELRVARDGVACASWHTHRCVVLSRRFASGKMRLFEDVVAHASDGTSMTAASRGKAPEAVC
mmetsp:Transcript_39823/g.109603  ORF Transcript_39823/g.109603 Transcript_39823/m.109603 type:complete len:307 (-) Transcript_39823:181-1101(-)